MLRSQESVFHLGGDLLEVAKEDVGRGIAAGERDAEPPEQGVEEGKQPAGPGEGEAHGRIESAIARGKSNGHHGGDGQQRHPHATERFDEEPGDLRGMQPQQKSRRNSR